MKLLIDLQGAQSESRYRGIGRYALSLAQAIVDRGGKRHEIWLCLNAALTESIEPVRQAFDRLLPAERIRVFDIPSPVAEHDSNNFWRTHAAELIREDFIASLAPDAVLLTSLFEGYLDDACVSIGTLGNSQPLLAVVHYDLIPFLQPENYLPNPSQRDFYHRKLSSLAKADLLLAISDHSRQEAIAAMRFDPNRVVTISSATDPKFCLAMGGFTGLPERFAQITRPFVLCVPGGFDARKNIARLIQAYGGLPESVRAAHQLVIASRLDESQRSQLVAIARAYGLSKEELVLTGYLDDTELIALYRATKLFVFPSLHEGFGLPVLEAMACGAPVIGSNATSIPEVIDHQEAMFDPESITSMRDCLARALKNPGFLENLQKHCRSRASNFSWSITADHAISALESAFDRGLHAVPDRAKPGLVARSRQDLLPDNHAKVTDIGLSSALRDALWAISADAPTSESDWLKVARAIAFHHPPMNSPRLLCVDVSEISQRDARTGIQRVVRALLLQMLRQPPKNLCVIPIRFDGRIYRTVNEFTRSLLEQAGLQQLAGRWGQPDEVVDFHQDDIYFSLDLNKVTNAVHAAHVRLRRLGVRCCFVVYDILPMRHPQWWPDGGSEAFVRWFKSITAVADRLACISRSVADDVESWLTANADPSRRPRVCSFYLGAEIDSSSPSRGLPPDADSVLSQLRAGSSFLMVGTLEPRKGYTQVLEGFELLWRQGHAVNLVIVGKKGWLVEELMHRLSRHPKRGKQLFWLEGISDEYLDRVYASCTCLIAASEGEGFGLPLIEASLHGLPIIARDLAVFREVAGEHATYFSGVLGRDIAEAVLQWQQRHAAGLTPCSTDMPRLTWQESALQLIKCLGLTPGES